MTDWLIYTIGFTAQILFSGRTIYQWISSEKAKKVIAPRFFWQLSLFASFLLFVYGHFRDDFSIMLGQSLTYFIYIRNIQLQNQWVKFPKLIRAFILLFPVAVVIYFFNNNEIDLHLLFNHDDIPVLLLVLGIIGQLIFASRFIYQWTYSEKKRFSSLPKGFWLISLIGSILILTYGILRLDPVLIFGHVFGIVVYLRNLKIIKNDH